MDVIPNYLYLPDERRWDRAPEDGFKSGCSVPECLTGWGVGDRPGSCVLEIARISALPKLETGLATDASGFGRGQRADRPVTRGEDLEIRFTSDPPGADPPARPASSRTSLKWALRIAGDTVVRGVHPKQHIPLQISYGTLSAPPDFDDGTASTCAARRSLYDVNMAVAVDGLPGYIG